MTEINEVFKNQIDKKYFNRDPDAQYFSKVAKHKVNFQIPYKNDFLDIYLINDDYNKKVLVIYHNDIMIGYISMNNIKIFGSSCYVIDKSYLRPEYIGNRIVKNIYEILLKKYDICLAGSNQSSGAIKIWAELISDSELSSYIVIFNDEHTEFYKTISASKNGYIFDNNGKKQNAMSMTKRIYVILLNKNNELDDIFNHLVDLSTKKANVAERDELYNKMQRTENNLDRIKSSKMNK